MKIKLLIVEDQFIEANNLKLILKGAGYEICSIARSVKIALNIVNAEKPDLVLLDIFLQDELTGIDLAKVLEKRGIPFVFISANSNQDVLDAAKSTRPYGFLVKPFRKRDVLVMLDVAWYLHQHSQGSLREEERPIEKKKATGQLISNVIGSTDSMRALMKNVEIVAPSNTSVLILGENGTGKELIAKSIHQYSKRNGKPFVVVNCAALPPNLIESELFGHEKGAFTGALTRRIGKFEQADGGTIFLDEIGELPLDMQVRFLRVLQEREIESIGGVVKKIDVRVLAATNRNLHHEVSAGRFRIDLYYRLNVFPLHLPSLRDRKTDIPMLADHFLQIFAKQEGKTLTGFSGSALQEMMKHDWPGNVRELQNLVERSVLLATGSVIENVSIETSGQTPIPAVYPSGTMKTIAENERDHIISVLERCNWKIAGRGGAAEILDMNPSTLNSRIRKLGIEKMVRSRKSND